ncbi:MAG TPA: hypothetical protein VFX02_03010 [Gammaproteobacteria bacterium]|nr:hypothetical protein [Gammaproteobacteria bacterium]
MDFSFSEFRYKLIRLSRAEVMHINRLIVKSAETMVFFRDRSEWVEKFVQKNAAYRVEQKTHHFRRGGTTLSCFTHEIAPIKTSEVEVS